MKLIDILVTPLRQIEAAGGDVLHVMKKVIRVMQISVRLIFLGCLLA